MRIFVLTATYELRVNRKSHLRDHPTSKSAFLNTQIKFVSKFFYIILVLFANFEAKTDKKAQKIENKLFINVPKNKILHILITLKANTDETAQKYEKTFVYKCVS